MPKRAKPIGQPTRGKTTSNRLRQVDIFVILAWRHILTSASPLLIDVGYGEHAWTALEMYQRLWSINPRSRLLGVEIDPMRVMNALPYTNPPHIHFCLGGFNLIDVLEGQQATFIRAYNVLRQYNEAEVMPALSAMSQSLAEGGILIEGTSTPSGHLVAFDVYQKQARELVHKHIVLGTNFRNDPTPIEFQAILPKRLIHHAYDDPVWSFFRMWERGLALARGAGQHRPRRKWAYAIRYLHHMGYPVDTRRRLVRRGYLVLRDQLISTR